MPVHRRCPEWRQLFVLLPQATARLWGRCCTLLMASAGYRPERYYMRGPGPKTRSRQSRPSAGSQEA